MELGHIWPELQLVFEVVLTNKVQIIYIIRIRGNSAQGMVANYLEHDIRILFVNSPMDTICKLGQGWYNFQLISVIHFLQAFSIFCLASAHVLSKKELYFYLKFRSMKELFPYTVYTFCIILCHQNLFRN